MSGDSISGHGRGSQSDGPDPWSVRDLRTFEEGRKGLWESLAGPSLALKLHISDPAKGRWGHSAGPPVDEDRRFVPQETGSRSGFRVTGSEVPG